MQILQIKYNILWRKKKNNNKYYYTIFKHQIKYYTKLNIYVQVHRYNKKICDNLICQIYLSKKITKLITKLFLVIVIIMILNIKAINQDY